MLIRHVQRVFLIFGAVFAALLFFLGGAALRLLMGPISLGPFAGIVEDALNRSAPGVVIRFDQAVLEWSRADGKVNLIVLGTKVFDLDGHIIAQAPKADLDFDAASMVAGHLNLKRFGLIGIQLTGVRSQEGAIRLGFGREQDEPDLLESIRKILENSAGAGASLDSFSIRNARLAFRDEPTGLFIIAPDASFTLENKGNHFDASLDSAVEISGAPARIVAHAVLRPDGMPQNGTVDIKGLSLPALVKNSTSFKTLTAYKLVSDVTASFSLSDNNELTAVAFHAIGAGSIENSVLKFPLRVDKFDTEGRYDGPNKQLTLDAVSFQSRQVALKAKAALTFGWKDGELATISGTMDADDFRLDLPDLFHQPIVLSQLSFQGAYVPHEHKLSWERAVIKGDPLSAELSGTASFAGGGSPGLSVDGTMQALAVADAVKYWPVGVADGARSWIMENIPQGRIGPLLIKADLPARALDASALPDDGLNVTFPFEGLTARYIAGMTPLTGGRGDAKLTGDTFHVAVVTASVGPVAVSNGEVNIPDLHTTGALTRIRAHSESTMSEVLRLIDEEPLGYPKRFGINPAAVAGHAAVDLDFTLPLLKDLTLDQLRIGVQAKATDLALPIDNRKLDHGTVNFAIDSKSLTSQGTANISSVPVTFKWTEDFGAPGITTRIDLAGRLDETTRANLALSEPKWLTGPMPTTLLLTGRRFHFDEGALKADLTNAAATIPVLNFAKRTGTPASATAQLHFGDAGAISVQDLVVIGEGLNVRGGLAIDGAGKIVNVSLSNLRSGKNDFAMDLAPLQGGGFAVRFQGKSLDAAHFFGDTKKTPNAPPPADTDSELQDPLSLSARMDKLIFHDDLGFRDVTLAVSFAANEKLTGFSLDAMGTGKGKVSGRMSLVKGVRNLSLDTNDAGAFIDTFTGFGSIRNGTLAARISFPGDAPNPPNVKTAPPDYQGTVTLSDFVVTDQPFVARLFSIGSLDGPLRLLQGQGIQITTMSVPFSARGKMVTIREGRAYGSAIGGTFAGSVDRKAERVDVTGTLVPVYGLNNVLGAVPILGDLLISKKGEGIFGLTYAMKGSLNEPSLTVNPLSVLTPGIFRRIFEFDPPKEIVPPQQPQPQASVEAAPSVAPSTQ